MIYALIENLMTHVLKNKTMHKDVELTLKDAKTKQKQKKFNCEFYEEKQIDQFNILLHHYGVKYHKIFLYFPGGSFIYPPLLLHALFAKRLAKKLKVHVIMVSYPLYYQANPSQTTLVMKHLIESLNLTKFSLIGDSAGACLALFSLKELQRSPFQIEHTILISPWIDGHLTNAQISLIQPHDFILNKLNCQIVARKLYALDNENQLYLCPSKNDFILNNKVLVISGGHEILTPDIIKWVSSQNILKVKHILYQKMCHCFILFPLKQSKDAILQIKRFCNLHY